MSQPRQFTDLSYNPYGKFRVKQLLPIYLGVSALFLGGFILAALPDDQPGVFGICCLGLWLVATVFCLLAVPFCRKKELHWELAQYDFRWQTLPDQNAYFYQGEDFFVRLFSTLLSHNDSIYNYDEVLFTLVSYNPNQHVLLFLHFAHENGSGLIPLSTEILHMIHQFDLELENPGDLEYIVNHPEEAFRKIYNSGSIHGVRHYLSQPPFRGTKV